MTPIAASVGTLGDGAHQLPAVKFRPCPRFGCARVDFAMMVADEAAAKNYASSAKIDKQLAINLIY